MTTPFTAYAFPATFPGTPTPRTMPDRLADVVNVKDYLPLGQPDGVTNNRPGIQNAFDAAFGTFSAPHGQTPQLPPPAQWANRVLVFPPGHYVVTSTLQLPPTKGGYILGAGSDLTIIENTTFGNTVIATDGWTYSTVKGITFKGNSGGVAFHYKDDGHGGIALVGNQECAFIDCAYENCSVGLSIGGGTFSTPMGSENLIINNRFTNCDFGLSTQGQNALQNTVLGGIFVNNGFGIQAGTGSVPIIRGCNFSGSINYDIAISSNANDNHHIAGCVSTSPNFLYFQSLNYSVVEACRHISASNGDFVYAESSPVVVKGCYSLKGVMRLHFDVMLKLKSSVFGRPDWLQMDVGTVHAPGNGVNTSGYIEVESLTVGTAPAIQLMRQRIFTPDGGATITSENYAVA